MPSENDNPSLPVLFSDFQAKSRQANELLIIAGPCVIEPGDVIYQVAAEMQDICAELGLPFVFKASYDKANRTSIDSYRGPGLEKGLEQLATLKEDLGLWVLSDVHTAEEATAAGKVLDIIQIPAFLCRQTDLVVAAAKTGKTINVKKGQFLSAKEIVHIAKKIKSVGNSNILITERGSSFGYNDLVVDFRNIPIIQEEYGLPVIFDATHSVQKPGAGDGVSGGQSKLAPTLLNAAVAAGAFGLFLEVHPNPSKALSDGPNMIELSKVKQILKRAKAIRQAMV